MHCYDDHRVAMAFSVLSAVVAETVIEEKRCVEKTWPNWWDDLENKVGISRFDYFQEAQIFSWKDRFEG